MAFWKSINELCRKDASIKHQVTLLYSYNNLPHKIRSTFATWIESTNWWDIRESQKHETGEQLFNNLMREISLKIGEYRNLDLDVLLDLEKAKDELERSFQGRYSTFVDVVRCILEKEKIIIAGTEEPELKRKQRQNVPEGCEVNNSKLKEMEEILKKINGRVEGDSKSQSDLLIELKDTQEKLHRLQRTSHSDTEKTMRELTDNLQKGFWRLQSIREGLQKEILDGTSKLLIAVENVWEERRKWIVAEKREFAGLSTSDNSAIQMLDVQFRKASELFLGWIIMIGEAINNIFNITIQGDKHQEILTECVLKLQDEFLPRHFQHILVFEKQPRILKKNGSKSCSFQLVVRMLGGLNLDQKHKSPKASISFLPESELEKIDLSIAVASATSPSSTCNGTNESQSRISGSGVDSAPIDWQMTEGGRYEIENGKDRSFKEDSGNSSFTARFYSLQLKNLQRLEKSKNSEYVTDFKYRFLIKTSISVFDRTYILKEVSLPFIVTSQSSQEIMARGTLIWHAAFSDNDRTHHGVKEKVLWEEFAFLLDKLFLKHADRGLLPEHLLYLAKMAFNYKGPKGQSLPLNHFDATEISYNQVMKDRMPRKEFSLWKWVCACLNLVSTLVKKEWKEGHIYGFISKEDAKKKLEGKQGGTFLLRFSETNIDSSQKSDLCGELTVAVQELDPETGELKLFHVRDYLSPKDIAEKGLAPTLEAMEVADYSKPKLKHPLLRYLWPDNRTLSDVFQLNNSSTGAYGEKTGYYKAGKFTIEIFLSERRQTRDNQNEDSNPMSVNSYQSTESLMDTIHSSGLEFLQFDENYINEIGFNSPKPTAKITPSDHLQSSTIPEFTDLPEFEVQFNPSDGLEFDDLLNIVQGDVNYS